MKILLFADNHYSQYSSIIRSRGEKYSTRLENQIKSLNWVNQVALEENCELMICLGDFFDKPELDAEELSALKEIQWNNLKKYFICGNHEASINNLQFNSANALSAIGKIIDKPTLLGGFGYRLMLLPYINEQNRLNISEYFNRELDGIMETQEVKSNIILSHNDISGIRYGQYLSQNGFNIEDIEQNCSLYINGHLHNQTQISKKILNLGNLTGQNFSEDGFKYSHSIAILNTETLSVDLIDNPYAFYFYKIEAQNIEDLGQQIQYLDKEHSIGTIKINEDYINEARTLCEQHFKEYRLLMIPNIINSIENQKQIVNKIDHIQQFKDYCLKNIPTSDILLDEISRLN